MRTPTIDATIERRILVNYRVDPAALARTLPKPFRPALVGDFGVAGICLIRLGGVRLPGLPAAVGLTTENAAHRVAVEWDTPDGPVTGVYIPRRDTSSRLSALLGGRLFPGWQHRARFRVDEGDGSYRVEVSSDDGNVHIGVTAHRSASVMPGSARKHADRACGPSRSPSGGVFRTSGSVFESLEQASRFFRCAPLGYAATRRRGVFDGVALAAEGWAIQPLHLDDVRSSFFEDPLRFAPGTATPDSAFLMAGLDTCWRALPALVAAPELV